MSLATAGERSQQQSLNRPRASRHALLGRRRSAINAISHGESSAPNGIPRHRHHRHRPTGTVEAGEAP